MAKGFNLAITPDKVPHNDYILATKLADRDIISMANKVKAGAPKELLVKAQMKVDNVTTDIANVLSKARVPKQNIDKQDREYIQHLAKR